MVQRTYVRFMTASYVFLPPLLSPSPPVQLSALPKRIHQHCRGLLGHVPQRMARQRRAVPADLVQR